jgi:RNA polymerase sigma factor (sigma-70 family)
VKNQGYILLTLLETEGPRLQGVLFKLTLREEAVEELMQDLFLNLYQSDGFAGASDPVAYAYRSAIHLASNWRRTRKRNPQPAPLISEPGITHPSPLNQLVQVEEIDEIMDAIARLEEPYKLVFVMRYLQEDSYENIAELLGNTPHQIRALCHKALTKLRNGLNEELPKLARKETSHVQD